MKEICRTCLKQSDNLIYLFNDGELPHKIEVISTIKAMPDDNLPSQICEQCVRNVHLLYDFRSIIIKTNHILQERQNSEIKEEKDMLSSGEIVLNDSNINIKYEEVYLEEVELPIQEEEEVVNKTSYKCKLCTFTCSEYNKIRNHRQTHSYQKGVCNVCGKTLRASNLLKHIRSHTEPPVACDICGKMCKNSETLRGHVWIHKNLKLECKTCGKIYTHRQPFRAHLRRHALGDVRTIKCQLCDKLFYDKEILAKHIRSHTGERPYPCEFCNKGFSSRYAMKTHRRLHTNEKPYVCEYCPMAFPQRVSLKTHLNSKHSELIAKNITTVKNNISSSNP